MYKGDKKPHTWVRIGLISQGSSALENLSAYLKHLCVHDYNLIKHETRSRVFDMMEVFLVLNPY